jgi:signal peptidase I
VPNQDDLLPVRIGSRGAAVEVRHLKVFRDIYYVAMQARDEDDRLGPMTDFDPSADDFPYVDLSPDRVIGFFSDAAKWPVFGRRRSVQFQLGEDEFFMLGDNSAASLDSRLWGNSQFFVKRDLLVGQGLLVYWPHSRNRIPGTPIPFPFFPNFSEMGRIR